MTYVLKPKLHHPTLPKNKIGYTRRDYEGKVSTLCAGCGHDSISAALIQAFWELDIQPHKVAKLSGIGCSSKTPDYFLGNSHSFSGDKQQLTPLIKAAIAHQGAAFIDVISPCVAFNNHPGSTKSYDYVRDHNEAVNRLDFWPTREAITVDYTEGGVIEVPQHDGSIIKLRKLSASYDPTDRIGAQDQIAQAAVKGEVLTGLLYLAPDAEDLHAHLNTCAAPFNQLGEKDLCPGAGMLEKINASLR